MSWLSKIVGGGATDLVDSVGNAVDKVFTSDEERLTHKEVMARISEQMADKQHQLNVIGAQSRTLFIAGWRPALGWIGAIALFMYYVPQYTIASYLWVSATLSAGEIVAYPATADGLMELVLVLLGASGLRSYDKKNGLSK